MPTNQELDDEEFKDFVDQDTLKKQTLLARERNCKYFADYLEDKMVNDKNKTVNAKDLEELLSTQEGRDVFSSHFSSFFFTLRVRDNCWPKLGYAENIRSHIKNFIIKEHRIDIFNPENFPRAEADWKKYAKKLAQEGKSITEHKEEVPPDTMNKIYQLLSNTMDALQHRSSSDYEAKYLSKIPAELHNKLHTIMLYGAAVILVFYEVRRAKEGLEDLKLIDFKAVEDETFEFRFVKKFRSEADKNHASKGTNVACSGVIPFLDILLDDGVTMFNPGEFFLFYMSLVPSKASMEGKEGGFLFHRPKKISKTFNIHDPNNMAMFEANMKGEEKLDNKKSF